MTVFRGFAITIASGLAFMVGGGLIGLTIGTFLPDYYRTVFRLGPHSEIEPWQVGLGLGLTQGLAAGLIVGCVIVVAVSRTYARGSGQT